MAQVELKMLVIIGGNLVLLAIVKYWIGQSKKEYVDNKREQGREIKQPEKDQKIQGKEDDQVIIFNMVIRLRQKFLTELWQLLLAE